MASCAGTRLIPRSNALPAEAAASARCSRLHRLQVAVVDDEPQVLAVISAKLEYEGLEVIAMGGGELALARLRQDSAAFDLLVTDQTMPGLSGTELIAEAHRLRPELPAILVSGYSDQISDAIAGLPGVSRFLHKPLERVQLLDAVATLLGAAPRG